MQRRPDSADLLCMAVVIPVRPEESAQWHAEATRAHVTCRRAVWRERQPLRPKGGIHGGDLAGSPIFCKAEGKRDDVSKRRAFTAIHSFLRLLRACPTAHRPPVTSPVQVPPLPLRHRPPCPGAPPGFTAGFPPPPRPPPRNARP
jgi:hypothetical protein